MKIPIKAPQPPRIAPHVKWFCTRTSFGVVLKESRAASRIIAISIIAGTVSVTSLNIGIPITSPAAFWNAESFRNTLSITAMTIITIYKKLWAPFILMRGSFFFHLRHKSLSDILLVASCPNDKIW